MNKNTKLGNDDNGAVLTAEEAILSGVASNRPQDICTKYPEKCTELQVAADDCNTCCNTVNLGVTDCPDCPERLLYAMTVVVKPGSPKDEYYAKISNISDIAITNIKVNILSSVTHHSLPVVGQGSVEVIGPGTREWIWTIDSLAPNSEVDLRLKISYAGYALCMYPTADAPAELTADSVLYCKHTI